MPFFRYSTTNPQGQTLEGTIQAPSATEAMQALTQRGYRNTQIFAPGATPQSPPPQQTQAVQAQPQPIHQSAYQPAPQPRLQPATGPQLSPSPQLTGPSQAHLQAPLRRNVIRTKQGSDRDRFFLFSQIGQQLKAGINPAQAFQNMAHVTQHSGFKRAFENIARGATAGERMSDIMEKYTDLFPDHVVGTVRAGEEGGFLPEALEVVSKQAEDAHKFKRFHWWMWMLGWNALIGLPLMWALMESVLTLWDRTSETGGTEGANLIAVLVEKIIWPYGPLTIALYLLLFGIRWWFGTRQMASLRHSVGSSFGSLKPRARHEALTMFSWALSRLSQSGVPPHRSWSLAADSVPNLAVRRQLLQVGTLMREKTPLSEAARQTKLLSHEYVAMLSTGEMTGTVPGTLDQLMRASRIEYEAATSKAKIRSISLGCAFTALVSVLMMAIFYWVWLYVLPKKVLEDVEDLPTIRFHLR